MYAAGGAGFAAQPALKIGWWWSMGK